MPRQLLRDRQVVPDDWHYAEELDGAGLPGAGQPGAGAVIMSLEQWRNEREGRRARGARTGVVLLPEHKVEDLAADIALLSLFACRFPGPAEGRGYTQGRLLRERYGFKGELRATGYVRLDQLFFLARCGFDSFELEERDIAGAAAALATFTAAYQPANDLGLAARLPLAASL